MTSSTGFELKAGESLSMDYLRADEDIFAVTASVW